MFEILKHLPYQLLNVSEGLFIIYWIFYAMHSSLIFLNYMYIMNHLHGFTNRLENKGDPDQLDSEKINDLDLNCFQNRTYQGINGKLM